ncbi:MAG: hypothetical protein ACPIOQ_14780, partial [Promethearchaeia archaeon]
GRGTPQFFHRRCDGTADSGSGCCGETDRQTDRQTARRENRIEEGDRAPVRETTHSRNEEGPVPFAACETATPLIYPRPPGRDL